LSAGLSDDDRTVAANLAADHIFQARCLCPVLAVKAA
jgi:hypothetical protein